MLILAGCEVLANKLLLLSLPKYSSLKLIEFIYISFIYNIWRIYIFPGILACFASFVHVLPFDSWV